MQQHTVSSGGNRCQARDNGRSHIVVDVFFISVRVQEVRNHFRRMPRWASPLKYRDAFQIERFTSSMTLLWSGEEELIDPHVMDKLRRHCQCLRTSTKIPNKISSVQVEGPLAERTLNAADRYLHAHAHSRLFDTADTAEASVVGGNGNISVKSCESEDPLQ